MGNTNKTVKGKAMKKKARIVKNAKGKIVYIEIPKIGSKRSSPEISVRLEPGHTVHEIELPSEIANKEPKEIFEHVKSLSH